MWEFWIDNVQVQEPVGWSNMQIIIKREPTYHGIFPEYSFDSLKFRCDTYDYLRSIYESNGPGHTFTLEIRYLCNDNSTPIVFWQGKILLSDVSFIEGQKLADVTIWDQTVIALLNSRFDQPVNILDPTTVSGAPVQYDYESANLFPIYGNNNQFALPILEEWQAAIKPGPIAELLGEENHSIVNANMTVPFGSGRFGTGCNIDFYNAANGYPQGAIVTWPFQIPWVGPIYRAVTFVPPGNFPPNPLFWQLLNPTPGSYNSQTDLGYKAEWFLRRVIVSQGPGGIPRLALLDNQPLTTFLMADPATQDIPNSNFGTTDTEALSYIWLRPVVLSNSINAPNLPATGPVVSYGFFRTNLSNVSSSYVSPPNKCLLIGNSSQQANVAEPFFFEPPAPGNYTVNMTCTINVEYVIGAMSPYKHDTSHNPNCSVFLPSGCSPSCPPPATSVENAFGQAELAFEVYVGSTVYDINNPGASTGFSSGVICGNHVSDDPGTNAVKGNFTFNLNINGTFFLTPSDGIKIRIVFAQTSRYLNKVVPPQAARVAHALAVIDVATTNCCLSVYRQTTFEAPALATIPFFGIYEVGQRLLDKLTENSISLRSTIFSRPGTFPIPQLAFGCGSTTFITQGSYIRGGELDRTIVPPPTTCSIVSSTYSQKFQLSFKEFIEAINSVFTVGFGIDLVGDFRIEDIQYFYPSFPVLVLNLGDKVQRKLVRKIDTSRIYSIFRAGYDKWESDVGSGRAEFNSDRVWNFRVPYIKNELNRICKWIAAAQVFETTRRNHISVTGPVNFTHDFDVFFMVLDQLTPTALPERGVDTPSPEMIFPLSQLNWRLRPSTQLKRWLKWLGQTVFYAPLSTGYIYPGRVTGSSLAGGGDVTSSLLPISCNYNPSPDVVDFPIVPAPPFCRPEIISFDTILTVPEFSVIRVFPTVRLILTFDNDPPISGWISKLTYNPSTHIAQFEIIPTV